MADFPASPIVGSTFSGTDGTEWVWDGYSWVGTMSSNKAKVGEIQQIVSDDEIYIEGSKEFLKPGVVVLAEDYPDFPESKISKLDYFDKDFANILDGNAAAGGCIGTDNNGVWIYVTYLSGERIFRSADNGQTWKLVSESPTFGALVESCLSTNFLGDWILSFTGSGYGYYLRSTDNGLTWHVRPLGFNSIKFQPYTRYCIGVDDVSSEAATVSRWAISTDAGYNFTAATVGTGTAYIGYKQLHGFTEDGHWWYIAYQATPQVLLVKQRFVDILNAGPNQIVQYPITIIASAALPLNSQSGYHGNAHYSIITNSTQYNSNTIHTNTLSATQYPWSPTNAFFFGDIFNGGIIYAFNDSARSTYKTSTDGGVTWSASKSLPFTLGYSSENRFTFGKDNVAMAFSSTQLYYTKNSYATNPTWDRIVLKPFNAVSINSQSSLVFADTGLYIFKPTENTIYNKIATATAYKIATASPNGDSIIVSSQVGTNLQYYTGSTFANVTKLQFDATKYPFYDIRLYEYNSSNSSPVLTSQDATPVSVEFKPDGTKAYVVGSTTRRILQYTLSTPWNLSTAIFDNVSYNVSTQETAPKYSKFKSDGTKMFVIGDTTRTIYSYTLATPWQVSTATYDSKFYNTSTVANGSVALTGGLYFKSDGSTFWVLDPDTNATLSEYSCNTEWDMSTSSFRGKFSFIYPLATAVKGLYFTDDGKKIFTTSTTTDLSYEYYMEIPWNVGTLRFNKRSKSISPETVGTSINFSSNGHQMYVLGITLDNILTFNLSGSASSKVYTDGIVRDLVYANGTFYAALSNGVITSSTNTTDWQVSYINYSGQDYNKIVYSTTGTLIAFSDEDVTRSNTGGASFEEITIDEFEAIDSILVVDTNNIGTWLAVDSSGTVKRSIDDGYTWKAISTLALADATATSNGKVVTANQIISIGNSTWVAFQLTTFGANCRILRSNTNGETWDLIPGTINYPNSTIKITYSSDKKDLYLYCNTASTTVIGGIARLRSTIKSQSSSNPYDYLRIK